MENRVRITVATIKDQERSIIEANSIEEANDHRYYSIHRLLLILTSVLADICLCDYIPTGIEYATLTNQSHATELTYKSEAIQPLTSVSSKYGHVHNVR